MSISVLPQSEASLSGEPLPEAIRLPDEFSQAVAINRTTLRVLQMTDYLYTVPARNVVTHVRLIPAKKRGWQTRLKHRLQTAPLPHTTETGFDIIGNEFWDVQHERIQEHLTFAAEIVVQNHCAYSEDGIALPTPIPGLPGESLSLFCDLTPRTQSDTALHLVVDEVYKEVGDRRPSITLFVALCKRVHQEMHFDTKATGVQTSAAAAWQMRRGVCQDYSHITLCLCRLCGIPARYVSGFVPGEGVMHAWVEASLPIRVQGKNKEFWFAYDPTYNKWVDDNYVTVAVGRDYGDITPTSGTYFGGGSTVKYRNKVTVTTKRIHLL